MKEELKQINEKLSFLYEDLKEIQNEIKKTEYIKKRIEEEISNKKQHKLDI